VPRLVHLINLAERRPRACSVENAEVGLEHDQREVDSCIAWLRERLASGPTLTAQILPSAHQVDGAARWRSRGRSGDFLWVRMVEGQGRDPQPQRSCES
jgi:hypothetical protein